jgi:hypothetical protein
MKKVILALGITALFIGMPSILAGSNVTASQDGREDWHYVIFGYISSYEIIELEGKEYLNCEAIHVKSIWLGVIRGLPNLPVRMVVRFGREFGIPYDGAEIIGPNRFGHYFIMASGVL